MVVKSSKKSSRIKIIVLGVIGILVIIWLGIGVSLLLSQQDDSDSQSVTQRDAVQNDGNMIATTEEAVISSVYEAVSPSVVSILTQVEDDSSFYYRGSSLQQGAGTGIIVGENGYVLTNKHVVDGARDIQVVLDDGQTFDDVRVLGADPLNDIAFLKIEDVNDLPVAKLGDSTTVKIGQQVLAIGNSLGQYNNTVTSGIISGTGRPIAAQSGDSIQALTDLIQTDAAINPGNSGGPLLNSTGQVIGINTAIAQNAEGIGFAIPINAAKGILKQVLAGEKLERAYLGVRYIPVTPPVAKQYDLSVDSGALIEAENNSAVEKNSPAAKAGIKQGDVITKVNDVEVGERGGMASLIAEYAPGDVIKLEIVRDGQTISRKVTLGAYQD